MKLGIGVPISGRWATPDTQVLLVQRAEELGYDSAWTLQRLLVPESPDGRAGMAVYRSILDAVIPLAFLAGQTTRLRLGTAVLNAPFFAPTVLAKQLTTLDILSRGRLDVGLGAGWSPEEFASVGVPMEHRGARLEEFVQALRALWTEEVTAFDGRFYQVPAARMEPKPAQRPHPPLLLGAKAPAALQRAGRVADGWISFSGQDLTRIDQDITTIKEAASAAGRDPEALRFVCRGVLQIQPPEQGLTRRPLFGSVEQIQGDLEMLRGKGVTEVFFDLNYDPRIGSPDADPGEATERALATVEALAPARTAT